MKSRHLFALIPTLLWTDFPVRPPAGELRSTKFAPGKFVPEGEGLENPSPCGRGEGVRDGFQIVAGHFVRRT